MKKLKKLFKYVFRYGCYLKTFEEYYEFVICSDVHNFPLVEKKTYGGKTSKRVFIIKRSIQNTSTGILYPKTQV